MSKVRKIDFFVAPIFGICIEFLDLLFLNKLTIVSLVLPPSPLTILSLLALNIFGIDFNNPVIFNKRISDTAILLKPWMKCE